MPQYREQSQRLESALKAVHAVAKNLLSLNTARAFAEVVDDCLHILGEALGQNRVYIWKDSINDAGVLCCTQVYEWVRGVHSVQGDAVLEAIPYELLPSFKTTVEMGLCLNERVANMAAQERALLEPQGIQSLLIAPIIIKDRRWGFIGVDNCESDDLFTEQEENMLQMSGVMLASAVLKQSAEVRLHTAEALMKAMFDAAPLASNVWNRQGRCLNCNLAAVRLFGFETKEEFLERFFDVSPVLQPCGRPSATLAAEYIAQAFVCGHLTFPWMHQTVKGEPIPARVTLARIEHKGEELVAGYVYDLRELKIEETQRRQADERAELMLNAMPLCCNFWDTELNNIACNDEAVRLFDLNSQQEYLDRFIELSPQAQPCGRSSAELAKEKIHQAFEKGEARFEWMHQKLDGTPVPAEILLKRLVFEGNKVIVGYTRDLRAFKAMLAEVHTAHQALALARDEALAHSEAKSEFLANMSHEIRTPMNGIIGLTHLALQMGDISPQLRDYLTKIDSSAKALLRIINDVLDFSKITAGKLDIEHTPFDLAEMLENTIQPVVPVITSKGLEIFFDFDKNTPLHLVGDPVRLRQVILNLVTNATKFTHKGSIVIAVTCLRSTDTDATLCFSVTDTGIGIKPENIERLFDSFTQADTSITRRYGGTGLGLAICRQLSILMGGEISVKSTLGEGSTFSFTAQFGIAKDFSRTQDLAIDVNGKSVLLVDGNAPSSTQSVHPTALHDALLRVKTASAQPPHDENIFAHSNTASHTHTAAVQGPLLGKRALLVEDNDINQLIAVEMLSHLGMSVIVAANGREAVDYTQSTSFDVILMDIQMPEMDGMEATRRIRTNPALNATSIIAMTAHAMSGDQAKSLEAGMQAHLTKPIDPEELRTTLVQWLLPK